jgi:hypothetical protein
MLKSVIRSPFILSVFLAGCVAGLVTQQALVPPLRAGQVVPKWEHQCRQFSKDLDDEPDVDRYLAKMGTAGWEMVSHASWSRTSGFYSSRVSFCFKRPM